MFDLLNVIRLTLWRKKTLISNYLLRVNINIINRFWYIVKVY